MKVNEIVRRPGYTLRRIAYKFYEFTHPNEPWISQQAIHFCEKYLTKDQIGLEWGSGRSTAWFGKRLKMLLSIEFDILWHSKVVNILQEQGIKNVECRYIKLDHSLNQPTYPNYEQVPDYVSVVDEFEDNLLDFVVVDGHYRQACILAVLPKIKSGGLLLVDNTNWMPLEEWGVPENWQIVHQSSNVMTETTIWKKP
jgi:predicted O-methyltransferase YrrM